MNNNLLRYDWPLILAYHSINPERQDPLAVRATDFEKHIAWLHHRGFRSMTLDEFTSQEFSGQERIAIITFDDGHKDNYDVAFPILSRYGFVATIFLVSEYMNANGKEIINKSGHKVDPVVTWDQVHEMSAYGIEFGSHTCSHAHLAKTPLHQRWDELVRSRADLQDKLRQDVVSFCYPKGNLDAETIAMVEKAGYRCAVVTPRNAGIPLSRYTLRRVGIYRKNGPMFYFRLKTAPLVRRFYYEHERPRLFAQKRA